MRKGFQIAVATLCVLLAGTTAARAEDSSVVSTATYSQECLSQIRAIELSTAEPIDHSICELKSTSIVSGEQLATAEQIEGDNGLTSNRKQELLHALLAGAVKSKHYTTFTTGALYTATQDGTFYYDGDRAWVGSSYRGYTGTHLCRANYEVGVSISTLSCSESGSTSTRNMYYGWRVSLIVKGSPVSYEASNALSVRKDGTFS